MRVKFRLARKNQLSAAPKRNLHKAPCPFPKPETVLIILSKGDQPYPACMYAPYGRLVDRIKERTDSVHGDFRF